MRWFTATIAAVLALGAALAAPGPARADWDKTRWGMTPAQVKALYPAAREDPPRPGNPAATPTLTLDQPVTGTWMTVRAVTFRFDRSGKLEGVTLTPPDDRDKIETFLIFTFGSPVAITGTLEATGRANAVYEADYVSRETGDEATFNVVSLMGVRMLSIRIDKADPAEAARRQAMRRLQALRDKGQAPLPAGGWNNTRWTMSREQVQALYPAVRLDDLGRLMLAGPIQWHGRSWSGMAFEFEPDYGLTDVTLWVERSQIAELDAQARQWFGPPVHTYGDPAPAAAGRVPIYGLSFAPTPDGESAELFSIALGADEGTGLRLYAPDDDAALRAAATAPDPGPARAELHWDMKIAEFQRLFPSATATDAGGQFWAVLSPTLYGRTWKRGIFNLIYGGLDEFTLFSNDSFDAIAAAMTSLYGPPRIDPNGGFSDSVFEDNPNRARYRLRRMFDGTAMLKVERKVT